jgi:hypothetical protein
MESHEDFGAAGRGDFVAFYFGFGGKGLQQKKPSRWLTGRRLRQPQEIMVQGMR